MARPTTTQVNTSRSGATMNWFMTDSPDIYEGEIARWSLVYDDGTELRLTRWKDDPEVIWVVLFAPTDKQGDGRLGFPLEIVDGDVSALIAGLQKIAQVRVNA